MALELPPGLDTVLNILGVDWPQANEDEVVRLADELRKLASTIDSVQMAADKALTTLREAYHGDSADKLAELWGTISKYSRMVVDACGATATALNAAALVIEGCKGATLTQLVLTQGELAAASATGPWSTAAIIAAGKQIVSSILEEAVSALGQALAQPVGDLVETVVKDLTAGVSGPSNSPGFGVDLEKLASCAVELRRHADDIDSHGNSFRQIVEGLDVGRPGDMFGKLVIAAAEQIATSIGMEVLKRLLGSFRGHRRPDGPGGPQPHRERGLAHQAAARHPDREEVPVLAQPAQARGWGEQRDRRQPATLLPGRGRRTPPRVRPRRHRRRDGRRTPPQRSRLPGLARREDEPGPWSARAGPALGRSPSHRHLAPAATGPAGGPTSLLHSPREHPARAEEHSRIRRRPPGNGTDRPRSAGDGPDAGRARSGPVRPGPVRPGGR